MEKKMIKSKNLRTRENDMTTRKLLKRKRRKAFSAEIVGNPIKKTKSQVTLMKTMKMDHLL